MRRTLIFQSTHPSGVRLWRYAALVWKRRISIHAPQWGATVDIDVLLLDHLISIHAPQWGATEAAEAFLFMPEIFQSTHPSGVRLDSNIAQKFASLSFQSTHPSGVRRITGCRKYSPVLISIHAPQWGATLRLQQRRNRRTISIHAPQWGATIYAQAVTIRPTHFNPRTPVGCDLKGFSRRSGRAISIHAPQWGATTSNPRQSRRATISIHAPQWGATSFTWFSSV